MKDQQHRSLSLAVSTRLALIAAALATLPAYGQSHLKEAWFFNDLAGSAPNGTTTLSTSGTVATVRGAGASFTGTGLSLPGGSSSVAAYLDLPNGMISSLTDTSFEFWVTVRSHQAWQRVFDFGSGTAGELTGPGGSASGNNYLFLSANIGNLPNTQRLEWNTQSTGVDTTANLPLNVPQHIVVTFDDRQDLSQPGLVAWYLNGALIGSQVNSQRLATLNDVNNWLGRSQYTGDSNSDMIYDSFAIYDVALSQSQVNSQFSSGPDSPAYSPVPEASTYAAGVALAAFAGGTWWRVRRRA